MPKYSDDYVRGFAAGLAETVRLRIEFSGIVATDEGFYVSEAMRINRISIEDIVKAGSTHDDITLIGRAIGATVTVLQCH